MLVIINYVLREIISYLFSCNKPCKALIFSVSSVDHNPNVCKKHGYIVVCGELLYIR